LVNALKKPVSIENVKNDENKLHLDSSTFFFSVTFFTITEKGVKK